MKKRFLWCSGALSILIALSFCSCGASLSEDEQMVYDALLKASETMYSPESIVVYDCSNLVYFDKEKFADAEALEMAYFVKDGLCYPTMTVGEGKEKYPFVLIDVGSKSKGDYNLRDVYYLPLNAPEVFSTYSDCLEDWDKLMTPDYEKNGNNARLIAASWKSCWAEIKLITYKTYNAEIPSSGSYWITERGDINVAHINAALKKHWEELGIQGD